jgi:hypothetical protein
MYPDHKPIYDHARLGFSSEYHKALCCQSRAAPWTILLGHEHHICHDADLSATNLFDDNADIVPNGLPVQKVVFANIILLLFVYFDIIILFVGGLI